jgi:hypothetical protein
MEGQTREELKNQQSPNPKKSPSKREESKSATKNIKSSGEDKSLPMVGIEPEPESKTVSKYGDPGSHNPPKQAKVVKEMLESESIIPES